MVKYNGKRGFQAKVIIQTIHMQESCVSQWSLNLIMLMTVYTGSKNKHFSNFPCAVKISSYFMAQIIVFLNNSSYIIATFFFERGLHLKNICLFSHTKISSNFFFCQSNHSFIWERYSAKASKCKNKGIAKGRE